MFYLWDYIRAMAMNKLYFCTHYRQSFHGKHIGGNISKWSDYQTFQNPLALFVWTPSPSLHWRPLSQMSQSLRGTNNCLHWDKGTFFFFCCTFLYAEAHLSCTSFVFLSHPHHICNHRCVCCCCLNTKHMKDEILNHCQHNSANLQFNNTCCNTACYAGFCSPSFKIPHGILKK